MANNEKLKMACLIASSIYLALNILGYPLIIMAAIFSATVQGLTSPFLAYVWLFCAFASPLFSIAALILGKKKNIRYYLISLIPPLVFLIYIFSFDTSLLPFFTIVFVILFIIIFSIVAKKLLLYVKNMK